MTESNSIHRNDIYGDLANNSENPAKPAATVILLRDLDPGVEVLMLRKNSRIAFGGMWVFPGGRIDPEDFENDGNLEIAARNAAVREAEEEAGIRIASDEFVWFSHWTPPSSVKVRYATWFFAARAHFDSDIQVDGGEIEEHAWYNPSEALQSHARGEIDLAPPTWVTLHQLSQHDSVLFILESFQAREPEYFETRTGEMNDGTRVAMWTGDAGYPETDADAAGGRHRLVMHPSGFEYIRST